MLPELSTYCPLTTVDYNTLETYCYTVAQIREMQVRVRDKGTVVKTSRGTPQMNPDCKELKSLMALQISLTEQLGLSMIARIKAKHKEQPKKQKNGLREFNK